MSNELENPWNPKTARNADVVSMVTRLDRTVFELLKYESSYLNEITTYDLERIAAINGSLRTFASFVNSASTMDLPHSYPATFNIIYLTQDYVFDAVKNESIKDLVRMYVNAWVNWSRSESADKSNGWLVFDYNRFLLIMDRIDQYIASYVDQALPLDLPESSNYEKEFGLPKVPGS